MRYPVNEIFETIQGEATHTGTPSIFIRLQGCPVGCAWCDTKHTWHMTGEVEYQSDMVLAKDTDTDTHTWMLAHNILTYIKRYKSKHVVITGGEPAMYNLVSLTGKLIYDGYTVQIETSGTYDIKAHKKTWITVSPKYNMAGGLKVLDASIQRADEIKMPVGKQADLNLIEEMIRPITKTTVWLQPLSQSQKATDLCIKACQGGTGYKLSVQTHKYINVR